MASVDTGYVIECCCQTLYFGKCYSATNAHIATCFDSFNATTALCKLPNLSSIACSVGTECPKDDTDEMLAVKIAFGAGVGLIVVLVCLGLLGLFLYWIFNPTCCTRGDSDHKNIGQRLAGSEVSTEKRNILQIMTQFGIQAIILGAVVKDYAYTVWIILWVQVALLVLVAAVTCVINYRYLQKNHEVTNDTIEANDIYEDLSESMIPVSITFISQCTLVLMYAYSIYTGSPPDFTDQSTYVFYLLGAFVQNAYNQENDDVLTQLVDTILDEWNGKTKLVNRDQQRTALVPKSNYWQKVLNARKPSMATKITMEDNIVQITRVELIIRMSMTMIIHQLGTSILFFLLPLHLCTENAQGFVLNVVAIYFILEIDDLKDSKTITLTPSATDIESANDETKGDDDDGGGDNDNSNADSLIKK